MHADPLDISPLLHEVADLWDEVSQTSYGRRSGARRNFNTPLPPNFPNPHRVPRPVATGSPPSTTTTDKSDMDVENDAGDGDGAGAGAEINDGNHENGVGGGAEIENERVDGVVGNEVEEDASNEEVNERNVRVEELKDKVRALQDERDNYFTGFKSADNSGKCDLMLGMLQKCPFLWDWLAPKGVTAELKEAMQGRYGNSNSVNALIKWLGNNRVLFGCLK
ncbi:hypothetical protein HDU76_010893, partial [Blyttiomyces sp. JEL0837]